MTKFNWSDDDFRDMPDEIEQDVVNVPVELPKTNVTREQIIAQAQNSASQVLEEHGYSEDDMPDEDEEDYSEVLSDARLRLEQGRLWEMVMNHSLFEDMDIDPRAIKTVQKSIRKFAKEQMEVMLGMRQTVYAPPPLASAFNELEIALLKSLTDKMSGGKTKEAEPEKYVVQAEPVKRDVLKSISVPKKIKSTSKPLSKTSQAPLKRQANEKPTPEELLGLPKETEKPLGKHPSQMTQEERDKLIIERDKRIADRQKQLKSAIPKNLLPHPTPDQEAMLATVRATEADSKGTVSAIMALMNANKQSQ